jgi:hypothetical protein
MLAMLALALQTPTLEADNAKAAMTCAQAVTIADASTRSPLQLTSQFTYLAMQSVKARPGTGSFFDQLNALSGAGRQSDRPHARTGKGACAAL